MTATIVVADRVATNRIVLRAILDDQGWDVLLTDSVDGLMALTQARQPDLVIVSSNLVPDDLVDLVDHLRCLRQPPAVLAVTAPSIDARLAALEAGADEVISHPPEPPLLRARVTALLRQRRPISLHLPIPGLSEPVGRYAGQVTVGLMQWPGDEDAETRANDLKNRFSATWHQCLAAPLAAQIDAPRLDAVVMVPGPETTPGETCALVQDLASTPNGPLVIVAPARRDAALAVRALQVGAADAVCGGFDARELAFRLTRLISPDRRGNRPARLPGPRATQQLVEAAMADSAASGQPFAVMRAALIGQAHLAGASGTVAQRLARVLPRAATLSRLADDEFLILLPDVGSAAARRCALLLCHAAAEPGTDGASTALAVGVAMGHMAAHQPREDRVATLLALAARALAAAREAQAGTDPAILFSRPAA